MKASICGIIWIINYELIRRQWVLVRDGLKLRSEYGKWSDIIFHSKPYRDWQLKDRTSDYSSSCNYFIGQVGNVQKTPRINPITYHLWNIHDSTKTMPKRIIHQSPSRYDLQKFNPPTKTFIQNQKSRTLISTFSEVS